MNGHRIRRTPTLNRVAGLTKENANCGLSEHVECGMKRPLECAIHRRKELEKSWSGLDH